MDSVDEGSRPRRELITKGAGVTRLPIRGGNRNNAGDAGLGALNLNNDRTNANTNIGFRPRSQFLLSQKPASHGLPSSA